MPQNEGGLSDNGRPLTLEESIAAKKRMLLGHGIALWDVIASCDIKGSSDASIKNVVPAQVERVLETAHIGAVICNGGTAGRLYKRYLQWQVGLAAHVLPSTSPANAGLAAGALDRSAGKKSCCRFWKPRRPERWARSHRRAASSADS